MNFPEERKRAGLLGSVFILQLCEGERGLGLGKRLCGQKLMRRETGVNVGKKGIGGSKEVLHLPLHISLHSDVVRLD